MPPRADLASLERLVLGRLPVADLERLAVECADDSRLPAIAEAVEARGDELLSALRRHRASADDSEADRLAGRLAERLKETISMTTRGGVAEGEANVFESIPEKLGRYPIKKKLGHGGMGIVYLVEHPDLPMRLAVKTMLLKWARLPEMKARFLREANSMARVEHDHVVRIQDVAEAEDGRPFFVMPYLQGESLFDRLKRAGGGLPPAEAVRIARQMALGLAAAHAKGIIHRDVKPSNVWLEGEEGRVKILDFGLARVVPHAADQTDDPTCREWGEITLSGQGKGMGTPPYLSPEQACGEVVDVRADLYSLGVVLYEMLTGRRTFDGPNVYAVMHRLINSTPAAIEPTCLPALSDLTMRLLSRDREQRPASAQAVADELSRIDLLPAVVQPKRGRGARLAAAALLSLAVMTAIVILSIPTKEGTLIVELADEEVKTLIKGKELHVLDANGAVKYRLKPSESNTKAIAVGEWKVTVIGADGLTLDTTRFEMQKNGKVRIKVTIAPLTKAQWEADRKAAEWVLSVGGMVQVTGVEQLIRTSADLPRGPFTLTSVYLIGNKHATHEKLAILAGCRDLTLLNLNLTATTDKGLAHFAGCKKLKHLALRGTAVTDEGLQHFEGCDQLALLDLDTTKVTDRGLAYFAGCKNLSNLLLRRTNVGDKGLAHFKGCKRLVALELSLTSVTDAGLAHFAGCKKLRILRLGNTKTTDGGLAHFAGCEALTHLDLSATRATDAGLAKFSRCREFTDLALENTSVSDDSVAVIRGFKRLTAANLKGTKLSADKIAELSQVLPGCRIEHDAGVLRPKK